MVETWGSGGKMTWLEIRYKLGLFEWISFHRGVIGLKNFQGSSQKQGLCWWPSLCPLPYACSLFCCPFIVQSPHSNTRVIFLENVNQIMTLFSFHCLQSKNPNILQQSVPSASLSLHLVPCPLTVLRHLLSFHCNLTKVGTCRLPFFPLKPHVQMTKSHPK